MVAFRSQCNTESVGDESAGENPAQASFWLLEPVADAAMTYFYGQLFAMDTEIAAMFPAALDEQRKRVFRALTRIAAGQDDPARLTAYLDRLGRAHRKDGVRERHYEVFRRALLATFGKFGGDRWDDVAQRAWETAFDHAASVMTDAASRDAEDTPAWWIAMVTRTESRAPGIAVLTLQPDQPLEFLPGQHISVQTLHWPRQWRTYSIANAPRPDGTLTLHVRAARGGMVSHALVHHVKAGDPLILGAPAGAMTADLDSPRDLLCLAGGTGLAPIKSIVEAIALTPARGKRREIALYAGARRHHDLYDLDGLRELELAYPWLQVIPAVSDEPARDVMHGCVPELAAKASWPGRDIYVSGPDEMIARTVRVLTELGAPASLIHYDMPPEGPWQTPIMLA
jgi:NAD(P)H-flavin reductase/hemoglobin-like flavoprotein